jgi:hypothetical protein
MTHADSVRQLQTKDRVQRTIVDASP